MKFAALSFFMVLMLSIPLGLIAQSSQKEKKAEGVNWMTFEEAVEASKKDPKKIFVDVYTDWCGWCKRMDASTFNKEEIAAYLNEHYYAVKFNAEQKEEINFQGHTFKFVDQGRRGYHQFALALTNNKLSYPTVVFLDEQLRMIQPIPGYMDAKKFDPILRYYGEDKHKEMSWEDYQKEFKARF